MNTGVTRTLKALSASIMLTVGLLAPNLTNAAEVISLSMEYPSQGEIVKKTDGLKFKGDISGLVEGKSYRIEMVLIEVEGADYSNRIRNVFTVEDKNLVLLTD
ncbi:MAG: hypothetical protein KAT04_08815 [Methylococcales bacterium]|nr:hypothetical protein [Methylococcales bacterium]